MLLGLVLVLTNGCKKEEPAGIDIATEIHKEMDAQKIPSVVACVVRGDSIVWEGIYGYADVSLSKPATRQTVYNLESVSKLFLATTVLQLWESGKIDLEADINQYLPFEVRNPRFPDLKITVHDLLNHTSGLAWPADDDNLPDFHHFYSHQDPPPIRDWLPAYILPGGGQYRATVWKDFRPGEQWLYSNIGTSLLGLLVEHVSGMDYRDYCRKNIFEPLEMYNTGFRLNDLNAELLVTPYTNYNQPMYPFTYRHYPAGNVKTNLEDFSHFIIAFLHRGEYKGKKILEPNTVEKMLEVQNPSSGLSSLWWHYMGDCLGHDGGGTGFRTLAEWYPESNKAIFIFSNKRNESVPPGGRIYELVRYQCSQY